MSWNVQRQNYGYTVDGIFYYTKIDALQAASGDIGRLKLYFHDDAWQQTEWTSEPSDSWQTLVDRKCHQLRNKYQTLTLFFSGGYDSITILNGFIRNNLKIEELVIWERPWLSHLRSEVDYALELAKKIKQQHWPNVKITHMVRQMNHVDDFYRQHKENWIHQAGNHLGINKLAVRNWEFEKNSVIAGGSQSHTHGFIEGRDKPRLDFVDGKWYAVMNDDLLKWCMDSSSEQFYFDSGMPEIYLKQCYMMVDWLERSYNVTHELVHQIQSHMDPLAYEQWNLAVGRDRVFNNAARYGIGAKKVEMNGVKSIDNIIIGDCLEKNHKGAYLIWKNGIEEIKHTWSAAWDPKRNDLKTVISKQHFLREYRPTEKNASTS
jgi:hypothetical protein